MFGSGATTLIISNEEMIDIMKIIKSLEESGLLIKGVSETIKNEAKKQKEGFLGMLLRTLDTSLLGNLLTFKGIIRTEQVRIFNVASSFNKFWNTELLSKMNLNLLVFIQKILYLK